MRVQSQLLGVDVSKAELVICCDATQALESVPNEPEAIATWLGALPPGPWGLAVEATNTYHLALVEQAYQLGHTVYVVDGFRLDRYRQSIGGRAKTDSSDARLLRRYLEREQADLRPWSPPSKAYVAIQQLLHRRATLVKARVALEQSLGEFKELQSAAKSLFKQLARVDALIQKRLREAISQHGWGDDVARCQAIEGVGPLTAAALTMAFQRGRFRTSDAFVAFLGLDVRVRESGQYRGRRRLTKQGDPELRRLLYLAAMTASRSAVWQPFYQRYLDRGLTKTQALVILARKLARVAFALLVSQSIYQPRTVQEGCIGT
jgi:transposase